METENKNNVIKTESKKRTTKKTNKMSPQELEAWNALYQYVKDEILKYDQSQSLSKEMVLRLKGLSSGQVYASGKQKALANYSYETILNTFKYCQSDIQRVFRNVTFRDEMHKFNTVIKIVEKHVNDVYIRMKRMKQTESQTQEEISKELGTEAYVHRFIPPKRKEIPDDLKALF